ncbi:Flp family type IVb pilin [Variovorax sp. NFACC27]|jgi:pilus assembly protein Flp/PilA|uniref:Flp family type IVb pilin n=1 Tax=Variovorax gossypii TaxID=1679495 RepID=A0A431TKK0_9BURK|nr:MULTISPECIES: Flp family type IVb pilin [Variovorax]SEF29260.1 pilus assembly protein Flp/PilA [Variovorax sp. NFACC28]SEG92736.1 pilus assembly protein Flp/PilA [Variovorax sp. NFACC29]SFD66677.1 pilus assembly protein Flp/PilA [Variovorax sp. NFACC26]SFG97416.1 pilus assembly protein Flp/PilA [Variovorax sp. NFACC27]RTQ33810.1 Flp family type IVb pilin [Variovorax gossypii]
MLNSITRFLRDEEGATAIEYGIIAGLISIAIVGVLSGDTGLGKKLSGIFTYIAGKLTVPTT